MVWALVFLTGRNSYSRCSCKIVTAAEGCKTQRKKSPPTFSQQELARAAELCSADTEAGLPRHRGCAPHGWCCASARTRQWDGGPRAKPPLAEGSCRANGLDRAHIFLALCPPLYVPLLFVIELPQSILSSVLTRKRAWGLLMEKSLSLSALQCGYNYKENRIPCGIWGGGREKEQKL